jgi:DNA-binding SARP family transcriptional activator
MFCQEADDPQRALRSILSRIRQRVGADALLTEGGSVQLSHVAAWIDCLDFARTLDTSLATLTPEILADTIGLYRGAFLEDVSLASSPEFELWLLNERSRYQRLYERALEVLVARLSAQGKFAPALVWAQELVRSNPLLEEAHARLMWLYARTSQREAALLQYQHCRRWLQRELAVEPGDQLVALSQAIAAGTLGPPHTPKPAFFDQAPPAPPPGGFVGRAADLAALQRAWQECRPGSIGVALLEAEAGMGKTRLVYEFAATIPEAQLLVGACSESLRTLAFAPWIDLLEARLAQLDDAALGTLSAFARDLLARLLPGLARRLRRSPPPLPPSGGELIQLFAAVGELLLELPGPPLLLFIDNLQWADAASLQLFYTLARRSRPAQTLLIGALRSEEVADRPELQSLVSDLRRQPLLHLWLAPLGSEAISALVAQLCPMLPVAARPQLCEQLARATAGNPLFAIEILRELAHTAKAPSALPVPKSVVELVQRRLGALADSSRQVIEALAVLDTAATLAQARHASGRSEDEAASAIDMALRRGFLRPHEGAPAARYGFSHDIVREAVLGQLSHLRRQVLHRRSAQTLERAAAPAATLAYHWQRAGDRAKEGRYAALAGEQAAALFANEEAVRYLGRALELITKPKSRIGILCRLGDVWQLVGRRSEAEAIYHQALSLGEQLADQHAQARCQVALGRLMRLRGEYGQALTWLAQARRTYAALGDQQGLAQALGGMGAIYWSQLEYPRALACFSEQLDLARQSGDRRGVGAAVGSMGVVYTEQGEYDRALHCYAQRLQLDQEMNDRLSLAKTIGNMGFLYDERGEHAYALACYQALLHRTLELGDHQNACVAVGNMIAVYATRGEYALAERLGWQAIILGRALNIPLYLCEYLHISAELLARQGRYAEARPLNDESRAIIAQIDRTDLQLPAQLLAIRLQHALAEISPAAAVRELEALLTTQDTAQQQAAILDALWELDARQEMCRQRAVELYRRLYAATPKNTYRQRYEALGGVGLPAAPALPPPPDVVLASPPDLEALLARIDRLIAGFSPDTKPT